MQIDGVSIVVLWGRARRLSPGQATYNSTDGELNENIIRVSTMTLEVVDGDRTPNHYPLRGEITDYTNEKGNWSIVVRTALGSVRVRSSKHQSAAAIVAVANAFDRQSGTTEWPWCVTLKEGRLTATLDYLYQLMRAVLTFIDIATLQNGDEREAMPEVDVQLLEESYRSYFQSELLRFGNAKQRPEYDSSVYPSLFSELAVLPNGAAMAGRGLPSEWTVDELTRGYHLADPLAALLLSFIWKQGDFPKVAHVLRGLRSLPPSDAQRSVVLYQFGRHLADPLRQPIFDQHSNRALYLIKAAVKDRKTKADFEAILSNCSRRAREILFGGAHLSTPNQDDLTAYRNWWEECVSPRLPQEPDCRSKAMLWTDRWMFSLGKASLFIFARASEEISHSSVGVPPLT